MFSAYQTLNHVAAVRYRLRAGFLSRYVRVLVVLAMLLLGALATGTLTVVATALPGQPGLERAAAVLGSALIVFAVLLLGAKLLLARPAPVRALWPGAILGAAAVTVVLNAGAPLLARLVAKAGPVYGSFATVAGMFALLYLVGQALVYAAEVAAVRYARLWPRALDVDRPTAADARALALLAREQERIPAARVEFHLATGGSPPDRVVPRQPILVQGNAATPAARRGRSGRFSVGRGRAYPRSCTSTILRGRVVHLRYRPAESGTKDTAAVHGPTRRPTSPAAASGTRSAPGQGRGSPCSPGLVRARGPGARDLLSAGCGAS